MDADEKVGGEGGGGEMIVRQNCQFAVKYPTTSYRKKIVDETCELALLPVVF